MIFRRSNIRTAALVAAVFLLAQAAALAKEKPNVLFIAVDDLRDWVGYLGGYGGNVHTPNIDRLAARGMAFTNAHTASPVCCPSRAATLSGKLPSTTGIYNNQHWWKPHMPDLATIPGHFKANGYHVVGSGKLFHHTAGNNPPGVWHVYHRHPFDDNGWIRKPPLYPFTKAIPTPDGFPFSGIKMYSGEVDWGVLGKPEAEYDDVRCVDFAVETLKKKHAKPLFLACGLFHPHLPWYTPQADADRYPEKEVELPDAPDNDLDDVPTPGRKLALRKSGDLAKLRKSGKWRTAVRQYLASITFADRQIGKLLDALDSGPYKDNTIIMLWSDHGWHLGEKGHWHKRTLWEVATRVPMIVAAPNIGKAKQKCRRPVSTIDLFPTLIDLCDLPKVAGLDGESLIPLLKNPQAESAPAVTVDEFRNVAVRDGHYRYIRYADGSEELYSHDKDPHEWDNLVGDPKARQIIEPLAKCIPRAFAKAARTKKAYEFDPHAYRWKVKATGEVIEGGECELFPMSE